MKATAYMQGNLALSMEEPEPRRAVRRDRFTVIDGSRRDDARAIEDPRPGRAPLIRSIASIALLASILVGCGLAWASSSVAYDRAVAGISYERVTVRPGDTLWDLARSHPAEGITDEQMVDLLMRENGLSKGLLQPGQELLVAARP